MNEIEQFSVGMTASEPTGRLGNYYPEPCLSSGRVAGMQQDQMALRQTQRHRRLRGFGGRQNAATAWSKGRTRPCQPAGQKTLSGLESKARSQAPTLLSEVR